MNHPEKELTEKESLDLIAQMINKAKDACHDTGVSAMMWGALIAICSLVKFSEVQFRYQLPFDIYLLTAVAVIPQLVFSAQKKKKRKVKTYDDAFLDNLWLAFGICIFLLIYIVNSIFHVWAPVEEEYQAFSGHASSFQFYEFVAPFFLILYGMPTFVTGMAMKFRPMLWGGILCWVCCIITIYTSLKIDLLLTAFSAVFAWLVPGIIMERNYRKAKQELKEANV